MKQNHASHWAGCLAVAAGLVFFATGAFAEDQPGPEQVRDQVRKLEQKAQALKMDGKIDDAKAAAAEAAELREKIARMERERHQESVRGDERRRDEMKRKLDESRAELKELHEAGKDDRAAEVQQRIRAIEQALDNSVRRPEGDRRPDAQSGRGVAERRIQHIREAVAHLREAGLNDIAERVAQESERMEQQMHGGGDERRGAMVPGGEIDRMRAELQELRQAIRQLNARLDGAKGDRPDAK